MFEYILLIVGIFLLVRGADYLINGSSDLGKRLGVKPLVIGLTILAFGTSLPELAINIFSAIEGTTDINLGNVIGSNIANILLILGVSSLLITIKVKYHVVRKLIPFTLFSTILLFLVLNDTFFNGPNLLTRVDGIALLLFFGVFLHFTISQGKKDKKAKPKEIEIHKHPAYITLTMILGGILGLFIGGKLIIESATTIATSLHLSEFFVSATILAIGTSLPELIVSVRAALKKKLDFVVGNIVGSNVFNTLFVMGTAAQINPIPFSLAYNFDMIFLIAITLMLLTFMYTGKKYQLERWNSLLFLILYAFYIIYIFTRG